MDYPLEHTIDETQKIVIRRIRAISLLKLVAAGVFTVFIPMFVFFGFLALVGFQTVHVNGRAVTGVGGLFAAIVMAPIFSFIFTIGVWVMLYIGIRLWGYFKPFTVGYVPANKPKVQT